MFTVKVEICDRMPVYTLGLTTFLNAFGCEVISARTTFDGTCSWRADVLLLDADIIAAGPRLPADWTTPILLISGDPDDRGSECHDSPMVRGVVRRTAEPGDTLEAIRSAVSGDAPAADPAPPGPDELASHHLSYREWQVLSEIALGLTHHQIARKLSISRHTVDTYVRRIRSKLCLGNKAQLACAAVTLLQRQVSQTGLTQELRLGEASPLWS